MRQDSNPQPADFCSAKARNAPRFSVASSHSLKRSDGSERREAELSKERRNPLLYLLSYAPN